jgi:large subunit ribosomal protein L16
MLQPKRTKFRKMQKGKVKGLATRGHQIAFGSFALKSMEAGWITARQLEAARVAVSRAMKREGQLWMRVFPDKPITRKPAEVRMGKGKGAPEYWVAVIKPGTIIFEAGGVTEAVAKEALGLADGKIPFKTRFTIRRDYVEQVEKK